MRRVETAIRGLSTETNYEEGVCSYLLNLRKKNGALHPVSPRKVVRELSESYSYLFLHDHSEYKHLIGVRNNAVYYISESGEETLITSVSGKCSITQTGHVLNILDDNGIRYAWWGNGVYEVIDMDFSGDKLSDEVKPEGNVRFLLKSSDNFRFYYSDRIAYNGFQGVSSETLELHHKSLIKRAIAGATKDGLLTGFCLACTALKMYDGNYILHSRPVLISQPVDKDCRYTIGDSSYLSDQAGFELSSRRDPDTNELINVIAEGVHEKEKGYFDTHYLFVKDGVRRHYKKGNVYEFSKTYDIPNFASLQAVLRMDGNTEARLANSIRGGYLQLFFDGKIPEKYHKLFKSVDVFITPEVHAVDFDKLVHVHRPYPYETIYCKPKLDDEIIKELFEQENFYKVAEIKIEDIDKRYRQLAGNTYEVPYNIDLSGKLGEDLLTRERLPIDPNSRSQMIPAKQHMYNSRLHIADYKNEFFKGFPIHHFYANQDKYNFPAEKLISSDNQYFFMWWISVEINTGNGKSRVVRSKPYTGKGPFEFSDLMPMISYPDSRAYKATVHVLSGHDSTDINSYSVSFKLTPHKGHNFAYYISPDLKPIPMIKNMKSGYWNYIPQENDLPKEYNETEYQSNGLRVSALNNPMYFPASTSYLVSTGRILNMASNAMYVSERNFGNYPVFVATTQGWFMLQVGSGELVYSRITPATSYEVPVSEILCPTHFGIAFAGAKGIYLINSDGVKLVSSRLEEDSYRLRLSWHQAFEYVLRKNRISEQGDMPFLEYVKNMKNLIYDPKEKEIIVVGSNQRNYVISLTEDHIYETGERIDYEIKNTYPQLLVAEDNKIKDYADKESDEAHISFSTRPISFGSRDNKQLDRVYFRAMLQGLKAIDEKKAVAALHHSEDNLHFSLSRAKLLPNGGYRDVDMGLMSRLKKRWFIFSFGGVVNDKSIISSLEAMVDVEYKNEKMR